MSDEHDRQMSKVENHLRRAKEEIDKTLTFLEEVRRVEKSIERRSWNHSG